MKLPPFHYDTRASRSNCRKLYQESRGPKFTAYQRFLNKYNGSPEYRVKFDWIVGQIFAFIVAVICIIAVLYFGYQKN